MKIAALGFAAFVLSSTALSAATIRYYTPGGAPCAGVCTLEWAAAEFEVPVGEPVRMVIPAGTSILKMSYGKDGAPYWMNDSAVFAEDQPGQGYQIEGTDYWMVQIDECQNWALVVLPSYGLTLPGQPSIWTVASPPARPWEPWKPPVVGCLFCEPPPPCTGCEPPPCVDCEPPPPAVPLPASVWGLLAGLTALGAVKARRA